CGDILEVTDAYKRLKTCAITYFRLAFFFSSRRRHTRSKRDWSSDVCSSDLIPVNAPKCPYHSFHRDGAMRTDGNLGSTLHYEPNSYGEWEHQRDTMEPALEIEGDATHWDFRQDDDNYY